MSARFLLAVAIAVACAACSPIALAEPPVAAGPYRIGLEISPKSNVTETAMFFTITDATGKPLDTAGAHGRADFSSGGLKGTATLHPDGANRMKGYGLMSDRPDLTIDVSISLPGGPPARAVFKPRGQLR